MKSRMQHGAIKHDATAIAPAPMRKAKQCARNAAAMALLLTLCTSAGVTAELERLGPKSDVAVYWVGHSLMEGKAQYDWGEHSLMTLVGRFAEAQGLRYQMGDHTLWGSPMSALWRGRPHGYARDAAAMLAKREVFAQTASQYDTIVLTESLPVGRAVTSEYSSYYLRRFYCTLKRANPNGRVYLYQTWVNFQGMALPSNALVAHKFDWLSEMVAQRKVWEALADAASRASVRAPGWTDRFGWSSTSNAGCDIEDPIFIVPAGQALIALSSMLASKDPRTDIRLPGGERLAMAAFYGNPYVDWPEAWPLRQNDPTIEPRAILRGLKLRDASQPHDDIHLSALGIYFVALVHFATLYRRSPVGLPYPTVVGEPVARLLQCVAWQTVVDDPRAGVAGTTDC